ncbi:RNA polymerase sigma factor [Flagellimonas nanhaiensis]|uniref:RNA polymerase sigma factor n=1 Tax=Flagellimonas nanhaiensis TaxID=2292706 RepID=A0A371JN32_9FLAO|nr:RNA polymerase sigma factor [Allomuricauda nanhaiensis]RDY58644.1 RNA polymerase sigma factor [Allomuricauda nanhaiensis]
MGVTPPNFGKNTQILSDDELVSKILETNDSTLFGKLYDRYGEKIYRKCYSFVRNEDEAKDLTQDIFLKLFTKLHTYRAEAKFSTWLYSFTYNFLVKYKKRDPHRKLSERWQRLNKNDNHQALEEFDLEEEELFELRSSTLLKAIELVEPADKALLLMKYQDGILIKDIQAIFDINESAVKMRLRRARARVMKVYYKIESEINDKKKSV